MIETETVQMLETGNAIASKAKKPVLKRYANEIKAYGLMALPLFWWAVFFVFAFVCAFVFSFTNMRTNIEQITKFTLQNYAMLFQKSGTVFWQSLAITAIWTVVMMIGNNIMGLLLGFMINGIKRGKKLFLALLFWPSLVSAVVGADVAKMLFSGMDNGIANVILRLFGSSSMHWFSTQGWALFALMFTPFLLGFCTKLLIYYAAIISIPETYQEAAKLETDSRATVFRKVTMPLIKNAIVLNMVMSLIDGFKILGPMQLITEGNYGTLSTVLYIYQLGFERSQMARACAYSFMLFLIILLLTVVQLRLSGGGADSYD